MEIGEDETVRAAPLAPVWTVGHSTRSIEGFIELLHQHRIEILVDVRRFPGSRRLPHYNKEVLAESLTQAGIRYEHSLELGGRRKPRPDSRNTVWRNESFRGYADYMETEEFELAIDRLLAIAESGRTAIMCSEAVWWSCHRAMISDRLKASDRLVFHILDSHKVTEHPFTAAARIVDGRLSYHEPQTAELF